MREHLQSVYVKTTASISIKALWGRQPLKRFVFTHELQKYF